MILSFTKSLLTIMTVAWLCFCHIAFAGSINRVEIPKAEGDQCVEPTDDMRRNHMEYLLHKRDRTLREGVRTKTHSLKECINCHAVKGSNGEFLHVTDERHFCAACHNYAAVKIDCFQCHADRPEQKEQAANFQHRLSPQSHHKQLLQDTVLDNKKIPVLSPEVLDIVTTEGVKND